MPRRRFVASAPSRPLTLRLDLSALPASSPTVGPASRSDGFALPCRAKVVPGTGRVSEGFALPSSGAPASLHAAPSVAVSAAVVSSKVPHNRTAASPSSLAPLSGRGSEGFAPPSSGAPASLRAAPALAVAAAVVSLSALSFASPSKYLYRGFWLAVRSSAAKVAAPYKVA